MITALEPPTQDEVEEALRDVIDPELGVNVVDLGLIYELGWNDEKGELVIYMTLTTAECPLQDDISAQTALALEGLVDAHTINWVWMPAWTPARITDDGREMMRALGFNV
ncbi:metal-sulfur cluster assembly factor [Microbacterium sp. STN6]|uniref:metal-sulfur cluster assembly factor n=1 Tax=Microbacterium sp. STN6 TaxID=2995588 RepID=UPI002260DE50|nr:metal-sulfur cluster assembly factor [Microbacterium sp. STN6]MCX7520975.1 metal-sulfur cluster assembly factor [Microbacterium sp. STN6]